MESVYHSEQKGLQTLLYRVRASCETPYRAKKRKKRKGKRKRKKRAEGTDDKELLSRDENKYKARVGGVVDLTFESNETNKNGRKKSGT